MFFDGIRTACLRNKGLCSSVWWTDAVLNSVVLWGAEEFWLACALALAGEYRCQSIGIMTPILFLSI